MGIDVKDFRRIHVPAFKAKVALETAKEERTITELSREYGVHVNQIRVWKRQLFDGAVDVFESGSETKRDQETVTKDLHAKIGELTVERDFLARKLDR